MTSSHTASEPNASKGEARRQWASCLVKASILKVLKRNAVDIEDYETARLVKEQEGLVQEAESSAKRVVVTPRPTPGDLTTKLGSVRERKQHAIEEEDYKTAGLLKKKELELEQQIKHEAMLETAGPQIDVLQFAYEIAESRWDLFSETLNLSPQIENPDLLWTEVLTDLSKCIETSIEQIPRKDTSCVSERNTDAEKSPDEPTVACSGSTKEDVTIVDNPIDRPVKNKGVEMIHDADEDVQSLAFACAETHPLWDRAQQRANLRDQIAKARAARQRIVWPAQPSALRVKIEDTEYFEYTPIKCESGAKTSGKEPPRIAFAPSQFLLVKTESEVDTEDCESTIGVESVVDSICESDYQDSDSGLGALAGVAGVPSVAVAAKRLKILAKVWNHENLTPIETGEICRANIVRLALKLHSQGHQERALGLLTQYTDYLKNQLLSEASKAVDAAKNTQKEAEVENAETHISEGSSQVKTEVQNGDEMTDRPMTSSVVDPSPLSLLHRLSMDEPAPPLISPMSNTLESKQKSLDSPSLVSTHNVERHDPLVPAALRRERPQPSVPRSTTPQEMERQDPGVPTGLRLKCVSKAGARSSQEQPEAGRNSPGQPEVAAMSKACLFGAKDSFRTRVALPGAPVSSDSVPRVRGVSKATWAPVRSELPTGVPVRDISKDTGAPVRKELSPARGISKTASKACMFGPAGQPRRPSDLSNPPPKRLLAAGGVLIQRNGSAGSA